MERSFSHTLSFDNLQVLVLSALACFAPSAPPPLLSPLPSVGPPRPPAIVC